MCREESRPKRRSECRGAACRDASRHRETLRELQQGAEGARDVEGVVLHDPGINPPAPDAEELAALVGVTQVRLVDEEAWVIAVPDIPYKGRRRPLRFSVRVVTY